MSSYRAWFGCFLVSACISSAPRPPDVQLTLEAELLEAAQLSWQPRADHVAMRLPYEPLMRLKQELERREGIALNARSEASLIVLSSAELKLLRTRLSLDEIHRYIDQADLQKIPYTFNCVALMTEANVRRTARTYYLDVEAEGLQELRRSIGKRFVQKGGHPQSFHPEAYAPKITVAFTEKDLLRESDLATKPQSCLYQLAISHLPSSTYR